MKMYYRVYYSSIKMLWGDFYVSFYTKSNINVVDVKKKYVYY